MAEHLNLALGAYDSEAGENAAQISSAADKGGKDVGDMAAASGNVGSAVNDLAQSVSGISGFVDTITRTTQEVSPDVENINQSREKQGKVAESIAATAEKLVSLKKEGGTRSTLPCEGTKLTTPSNGSGKNRLSIPGQHFPDILIFVTVVPPPWRLYP